MLGAGYSARIEALSALDLRNLDRSAKTALPEEVHFAQA
jgi:hypothetical protein